jgi:DNA-binding transcriptional LysR family regulator
MLPPVLRRIRLERPDVGLQLEEMSTVDSSRALIAGELDVGVGRGAPRGRGVQQLVTVPVSRDYLVGVVDAGLRWRAARRCLSGY